MLAYELSERGLRTVSQRPVPVVYRMVRIEVVAPVHKKQLLTYLRLSDKRLGLLINFNGSLIKDGLTRIVNGLAEECLAKPQSR